MRTRVLASLTTVALSGAMFVGIATPAASAAPPSAAHAAAATQAQKKLATFTAHYTVPMTDKVTGNPVNTLDATFTAKRFLNDNGTLKVIGDLVGTVTPIGSTTSTPITVRDVTMTIPTGPTTNAAALAAPACDILNLVLGPLHLELLGLNVDLNQVVLNITAQPGAGNLLGNLLCAVAGLLDGPSPLNAIVALLNRILGL